MVKIWSKNCYVVTLWSMWSLLACMFPQLAPTAMMGLYSAMFFMVSAGHIRTTNGAAGRPDSIPVVSRRS